MDLYEKYVLQPNTPEPSQENTFGSFPTREPEWELKPWERIKHSFDQTVGSIFGAGSAVSPGLP